MAIRDANVVGYNLVEGGGIAEERASLIFHCSIPALARIGFGADELSADGAIEGRLLWYFGGKRV